MRILITLAISMIFLSCSSSERETVTVGSKDFTESVILGEIFTQMLNAHGIAAVHRKALGGTEVLWGALKSGDIDIYTEYLGTIEKEILVRDEKFIQGEALELALRRFGVEKTAVLGFNNSYALGMLESVAQPLGIDKISDLARFSSLRLVFSSGFLEREDGYKGLRKAYSLPQQEARGIQHSYANSGLQNRAFDVTDVFTTDAEIALYNIRVLQDDRNFFPRYDAFILYRHELAMQQPKIAEVLKKLQGVFTDKEMIRLNAQVLSGGDSDSVAASRFLKEKFSLETRVSESLVFNRIARNSLEHIQLVSVSMLMALCLGLPLGLLAARRRRIGKLILAVVGIIQTIPSLALLVFMIPLFGIGTWPAMVALFLYSLLPIVRHTSNGFSGINREFLEAAEVIGLPNSTILLRIEIPLASREILAGVKTAVIINIGTAVLGALIGAGGFGEPILTGIRLNDLSLTLQGALPAALMALLAQWIFDLFDRYFVPRY